MPTFIQSARRRAGLWSRARLRIALAVAAFAQLAACEIPTAIPQVDQRFIAPPQGTIIAVASLLPTGVRIVPDSSAFAVDLPAASVSRSLAADCPPCAASSGTTVAKPAFVATLRVTSTLPADLASAVLASGSLQLAIQNNYNFDPLRPSATARGYAVIAVMNGSVLLGRDSVDGATTALPPGASLARTIALAGAVTGSAPVTITLTLNSPAGDPVQMDAGRTIVFTATPANLRVASAAVNVVGRLVSSTVRFDLAGVDSTIITHVTGGALQLDVANPFAVAGSFAVQFSGSGFPPVNKSVALVPGASHPAIVLTQAELQSLLGHLVTVSLAGPVSGSSGAVTITPRQAVVVTSRFDVTLHTGG